MVSIWQRSELVINAFHQFISLGRSFIFFAESTTTRKAGGLDFPAPMGGERQTHGSALIVAVVIRLRRI
jgi:hypothetical protein